MQAHRSDQSQVLAPVLGHSAVSPFSPGARERRRSIEICVPLSSTNTRRLTSKREDSHRHRALAPSSRSDATFDFFESATRPEGGLLRAHRRLRDLHATLIQKSLAMLPARVRSGFLFRVLGQPLPQCLALNGRSDRGSGGCRGPRSGRLLFSRALDGGAGDSRRVVGPPSCGMPRSMAASARNLRSFEYGVHVAHSHAGPLLTQAAVRSSDAGSCIVPTPGRSQEPKMYGYPMVTAAAISPTPTRMISHRGGGS